VETFQPLINLLVLLSVLSIAAERIANLVKLKDPALRVSKTDEAAEKAREQAITWRAIAIAIGVAALVKADFFEIITHLDAPWETMGWIHPSGAQWSQSFALNSVGQFAYAMVGSVITGIAMGFGSKFWHDMLDIVFQTRERIKKAAQP